MLEEGEDQADDNGQNDQVGNAGDGQDAKMDNSHKTERAQKIWRKGLGRILIAQIIKRKIKASQRVTARPLKTKKVILGRTRPGMVM